jgi:predicted transposase YdaD
MAGHHDLGYKLLFAHPELVRELLAEFTDFGWLGTLDISAFERVNPGYVSERFSERQDDIVWRVRLGDAWLYIYILLEFQSGVDRWMALRMQVYVGLLYQDLVKRKELGPDSLLPPVLPLVFYNGAASWTAATELGAMVMDGPSALAPFQAAQRYCLIDQQRLDGKALAAKRSVLALLFRLELCNATDVLLDVLSSLSCWLAQDAQAPLQRSVASWAEQLVARHLALTATPEALHAEEGKKMDLVKTVQTWGDMFKDQGRQEGLAQGREQGREQGRQEARAVMQGALVKLLQKRFRRIPPGAMQSLDQASLEQLEQWLDKALDAPSIETLLGLPAAAH